MSKCYSYIRTKFIHILEQHLDKVDWHGLSINPNTIHILEKNLDKVNWRCLSNNPNAIHILEKNLDKIDWFGYEDNYDMLLGMLVDKLHNITDDINIIYKINYIHEKKIDVHIRVSLILLKK
jgi:hypothetical protein